MPLELIKVSSSDMTEAQLSDVIELCSKVFNCDYSYYMNMPLHRIHVLGYVDGVLVSHALWLERRLRIGKGPWLNAAYVEGMATHADSRRHGYGSALMGCLQHAIADYDLGALSPSRAEWYERLGWVRWRSSLWIQKDQEVLPTPDECVLVYPTPRSGDIDMDATLTGEWRPFELW